MSIVVAVKKNGVITVAADSQTNFGSCIVPSENHSAVKIRRVGRSFLAATGWGLYQNILDDFIARRRSVSLTNEATIFKFFMKFWDELHEKYSLVNDQCDEKDSPFGDLDASFLIVNRRGIYNVASDMSITRFERYYAIGSGADFAMGAIHTTQDMKFDSEAIARRAVETAIAMNVYCGGEIQTYSIKAAR